MKTKFKNVPRSSSPNGFTLIEVMLSVALMVVLLFGVNFIFSTSAEAVGQGQAIANFNREARGAQPVLFGDVNNIVKDGPCIIMMRTRMQYLNEFDAQSSPDIHQIAIDNKGNFVPVNPAFLGTRVHRVDIFQFCAHTVYQRRTADDNFYGNTTFGNDIFVHIGHGNMPSMDGSTWWSPDDANSPQTIPRSITGAYPSDWILNRTALLFKDPNNVSIDTSSYNGTSWLPEAYYKRLTSPPTTTVNGSPATPWLSNITPVMWLTPDTFSSSIFGDSRYDMVGCTLEQFRQICGIALAVQHQADNANLVAGARYPLWCAGLMYSIPGRPIWDPAVTVPQTATAGPQWDWAPASSPGDARRPQTLRFAVNPTMQSPVTSGNVAQTVPTFIQHCSQFVVEYAGDYLTQDGTGKLTGAGSDGVVDFYVDSNSNRHIRWYGLPRKTTTDTAHGIRGYAAGDSNTAAITNTYQDVIPLSDYLSLLSGSGSPRTLAPFEVECNFAPCADYAATDGSSTLVPNDVSNNGKDSRYSVAWTNNTPSMIRILIKVDDPNNKGLDGPWYEYVFQLK